MTLRVIEMAPREPMWLRGKYVEKFARLIIVIVLSGVFVIQVTHGLPVSVIQVAHGLRAYVGVPRAACLMLSDVVTLGQLLSSRAIAACFCAGRVEDALCCQSSGRGPRPYLAHAKAQRGFAVKQHAQHTC